MAAKDVKFQSDARDRMLRGVNILADAVQRRLHRRLNAERLFDSTRRPCGRGQPCGGRCRQRGQQRQGHEDLDQCHAARINDGHVGVGRSH